MVYETVGQRVYCGSDRASSRKSWRNGGDKTHGTNSKWTSEAKATSSHVASKSVGALQRCERHVELVPAGEQGADCHHCRMENGQIIALDGARKNVELCRVFALVELGLGWVL